MASVNKVTILGNLGRDPEVRYTPSNMAIATVSIATTYKAKDREPETEWHRVVFFGRQAEVAGEYLKKGSSVYVEGRLRTQKWTDKNGVERYTTEIVADQMQMLGGKSSGGGEPYDMPPAGESRSSAPSSAAPRAKTPAPMDDLDDDIPF
ncbi:MAG: single-stranded DNA-binding protein [Formosimonas sp.]